MAWQEQLECQVKGLQGEEAAEGQQGSKQGEGQRGSGGPAEGQ